MTSQIRNLLIENRCGLVKLQEDKKNTGGPLLVEGEFARVGVPTQNRRVYLRPLWETEIQRLTAPLSERRWYGELDHPEDGKTKLQRVSHIVRRLWIEGDRVMGQAEILPTDAGRNLRAILEAGCPVGVSSRGYGDVLADAQGNNVVQEGFRLDAFDFVADPADITAYPQIVSESVQGGSPLLFESAPLHAPEDTDSTAANTTTRSISEGWREDDDTDPEDEDAVAAEEYRSALHGEIGAALARAVKASPGVFPSGTQVAVEPEHEKSPVLEMAFHLPADSELPPLDKAQPIIRDTLNRVLASEDGVISKPASKLMFSWRGLVPVAALDMSKLGLREGNYWEFRSGAWTPPPEVPGLRTPPAAPPAPATPTPQPVPSPGAAKTPQNPWGNKGAATGDGTRRATLAELAEFSKEVAKEAKKKLKPLLKKAAIEGAEVVKLAGNYNLVTLGVRLPPNLYKEAPLGALDAFALELFSAALKDHGKDKATVKSALLQPIIKGKAAEPWEYEATLNVAKLPIWPLDEGVSVEAYGGGVRSISEANASDIDALAQQMLESLRGGSRLDEAASVDKTPVATKAAYIERKTTYVGKPEKWLKVGTPLFIRGVRRASDEGDAAYLNDEEVIKQGGGIRKTDEIDVAMADKTGTKWSLASFLVKPADLAVFKGVKEDAEVSEGVENPMGKSLTEAERLMEENRRLIRENHRHKCVLLAERTLGDDPDRERIIRLVGDVDSYKDIGQFESRLKELQEAFGVQRTSLEEERRVYDRRLTEAHEQIRALEEDRVRLESVVEKALRLTEESRLRLLAERRLTNHPQAGKIRGILDMTTLTSEDQITEIFEQFRAAKRSLSEMADTAQRIRTLTRSGYTATSQDEETPWNTRGQSNQQPAMDPASIPVSKRLMPSGM